MLSDFLKAEFESRTRRNPHYSLRAFAKSLNVNAGTLSQILNGRRRLSPRKAVLLLEGLALEPAVQNQLLMSLLRPGVKEPRPRADFRIGQATLEVMDGWEYYAILSLLELDGFRATLPAICRRLRLPSGAAYACLRRMERLGLVNQDGRTWRSLDNELATTAEMPSPILRKIHRQYIEKAVESMDQDALDERDVTGCTIAISAEKLALAKRRIREFRKEMLSFLESGKKDRVYRLNIQLYPLDKGERQHGHGKKNP